MNTVVLEVRSLPETLSDAALAMNNEHADSEAHISFATPELLWAVLTAKRWEILKILCGAGPISIRETSRRVGRDVKAVHGDVTALLEAGVLNRVPDGRVEFPYDTIKVEFMLEAA
jgi:predicted transcriptional regulator